MTSTGKKSSQTDARSLPLTFPAPLFGQLFTSPVVSATLVHNHGIYVDASSRPIQTTPLRLSKRWFLVDEIGPRVQ